MPDKKANAVTVPADGTVQAAVPVVHFTDRPDIVETFANDFLSLEIRDGTTFMTFGVRRAALGKPTQGGQQPVQRTVVARLALTANAVNDMMRQFATLQAEIAKANKG